MPRKKQTESNKQFLDGLHHRLREGLLICAFALSFFLLLTLLTYHNADPGWSNTGSDTHIGNAGGRAGAWFSDFFLSLFGYVAYLFPLMIAHWAWAIFREKEEQGEMDMQLLIIRFIGFIVLLLSACALLDLSLPNTHFHIPDLAGGMVGNEINAHLISDLNPTGTAIVLMTLFLCSATMFFGVSWFKAVKYAGIGLVMVIMYLYGKFQLWRENRAQNKTQLKAQLQAQPKIKPKLLDRLKEDKQDKQDKQNKKDKISKENKKQTKLKPRVEIIQKAAPVAEVNTESKETVFVAPNEAELPNVSLLDQKEKSAVKTRSTSALEAISQEVEKRLFDFGIEAEVVAVHPGPVITRFELDPAPGIKVSKITALAKDLARALSTTSVRIVDVIPGKSVVGLELPNEEREVVRLREIIESQQYHEQASPLALALGKDIAGHPVIVDLAKMPHLLVAGTTGSGKSVGLNAMLLSLLYKASPKEVRLILVDPKMLELSIYDGIPHLLSPVVTDMKDAANALRWCVAEMERRYRLMAALGVRNLNGFNQKVQKAIDQGKPISDPLHRPIEGEEAPHLETLPYLVVIIDELADMMMVVGKKVEQLIARIAQKARAAGIHLILATQRPSVDVITGLIKANIPTRIAFQVSSKVDSRTIIDQQGAENLLGHGDMLYLPAGTSIPVRVHGAFVADQEVHNVVAAVRKQGEPNYISGITEEINLDAASASIIGDDTGSDESDPLYDQVVEFVTSSRKASISSVQRRFKIGYNRAARIIEELEVAGVVSAMEGNGSREVLAPPPVEN